MHALRIALSLTLLLTLAACPKPDEGPTQAACGDFAQFDLSSCDRDSLAQVDASGIWNVNMYLHRPAATARGTAQQALADEPSAIESAVGSPTAWNLTPGETVILGRQAIDRNISGQTFYLSTKYTVRYDEVRYAFAGCSATAPGKVSGQVLRCLNGVVSREGTFEAVKLSRIAGEAESSGLNLVSEVPLTGTTADVYVTNGYAFVPRFWDGLTIIDVRDPAKPTVVSTWGEGVDYWNDVWVKDNVAFLSGANLGLVSVDVSDPAHPVQLGSLPKPAVDVHTTFIDGNTLYAISPGPNGEVLVVDVTTPAAPVLKSRFVADGADPTLGQWPHDAFAFNGRLYVSHWSLGLVIADATNPARLVQLGSHTYADATSHANAVGLFGDRTLAFEGGEAWNAHLRVVDVTDPTKTSLIGELALRPEVSIHNMLLDPAGKKLYVANYQDGVRVLDVSRPEAPRQLAYYNTWRPTDPGRGTSFYEGALGIRRPGDGYLYVAETERGLLILREP